MRADAVLRTADRKEKEREFHDRVQSELMDNPGYSLRKHIYSIAGSNRAYVVNWLSRRCQGKRVLDFCCGDGDLALDVSRAGGEAHGIDISPVSIQNARRKASTLGFGDRVSFRVMDGEAMEFPDNYFDLVAIQGVLHHLDLHTAYRELARVLKPEGELICIEPLRHNPLIQLYRRMTPHLRTEWELRHILGKPEIEMAREYFEKVEVLKFFHLFTIAAIPLRRFRGLGFVQTILDWIDSILLRLPLIRWQAWMVVFALSCPRKPPAMPGAGNVSRTQVAST